MNLQQQLSHVLAKFQRVLDGYAELKGKFDLVLSTVANSAAATVLALTQIEARISALEARVAELEGRR